MDPLLACCSKKSSLKVVPEYPSCPGCSLSRVHLTWNHARCISLCVALSSSVVSSLPLVILLCLNTAYPWIGVDFLILYSIFIRSAEYFLKFLFEESDYNLSVSSSTREVDSSLLFSKQLMSFLQVLKCFIYFPLNQTKLVISSSLRDYHKIQVKQLACWLFFFLKGRIQSGYKLLLFAQSLMLNRFHSSSFLVFILSSEVEKGKHMLGFYVYLEILNYQTLLGLGFLVRSSVLVLSNLYEIGVSILCLRWAMLHS